MSKSIEIPKDIHENFDSIMQLIERRKAYNGGVLHRSTGGIIQHGVLKGYALHAAATWLSNDIGSQLLGLYEQEVCALLWHLRERRDLLIDLGAADGFYGLGLIAVGAYARSLCFEIDPESRAALGRRRDRLGLAERVEILGDAVGDLPAVIRSNAVDLSRAVILCDIEGAEFDLFTDELLEHLASACLIIENHDFNRANGFPLATDLVRRAGRHFHVTEIHPGPRTLHRIPLIETWNDNDRALLLSEGRLGLASWLVLSPLSAEPLTPEALSRIQADYVRAHWD